MRKRRRIAAALVVAAILTVPACDGDSSTSPSPQPPAPTRTGNPNSHPVTCSPTPSSTSDPDCAAATPIAPTRSPSPTTALPTPQPTTRPANGLMPVVEHGPRDRKRIALTFDADLTAAMRKRLYKGRVKSYYNARLIQELRQLHVPATLFLTGMWMEQYPQQTRELAADPLFELGSHSYTHRGFTKHCYTLGTVPKSQMLADVSKAAYILKRLDPRPTKWFRFPGGCHDGTALHELAPTGLTAIQMDVPGADGFARQAGPIADRVVRQARNGSIVVLHMHGGDNAPMTDEAIPPIVRELRAKGFELVTITRLLQN